MSALLERYGYLLIGIGGFVLAGWYLRSRSQARVRKPSEDRTLLEKWLDPFDIFSRSLTKRELVGWAAVVLLMIAALLFLPRGRGW
jgi:hypothetical protein